MSVSFALTVRSVFLTSLLTTFLLTSYAQCDFTIAPSSSTYGCYSTLENAVFTSLVNVTAVTNNLTKSAGGGSSNAGEPQQQTFLTMDNGERFPN